MNSFKLNKNFQGERTIMFHFGCMLGGAITPMVGGFLFHHVSPMAVWKFNIVSVILQVCWFNPKIG